MYNGIGLTTPRGSGTNGHVQRNWAFVRPGKKDNSNYRSEDDIKKLDATLNRPPNKDILDHDRKRKIEVKCLEFEEILEKQGLPSDEIKAKVDSYRQKLMGQGKTDLPKDEFGRIAVRDTHQIAEAQHEKNAKLREAFNISEYFVEGSSFDSDRKAKEDLAKSLALQKELDVQRDQAAAAAAKEKHLSKRYALVRTPSIERDGSTGVVGDGDNNDRTFKKKKKKRTRESSASPERKKDKKKKSKKRKKESKSKKSKKLRHRKGSDSETNAENDKDSGEEDTDSQSEIDVKRHRKKSKKDKKKRVKKNKKKSRSSSSDKSRSTSPVDKSAENKRDCKKTELTSRKKSDNPFRSRSKEKSYKTKESQRRHYESSRDSRSNRSRSHDDKNLSTRSYRSRSQSNDELSNRRSHSHLEKDSRINHRREKIRDYEECTGSFTSNRDKDRDRKNRKSRSRERSSRADGIDSLRDLKHRYSEERYQKQREIHSQENRGIYSRSPSRSHSKQACDNIKTTKRKRSQSISRLRTPSDNSAEHQLFNRCVKKSRSRSSVHENVRKTSLTPPPPTSKEIKLSKSKKNIKEKFETNSRGSNFKDIKSGSPNSRSRTISSSSPDSASTDAESYKSRTPSPREQSEKPSVSKNIDAHKSITERTKSSSPRRTPPPSERRFTSEHFSNEKKSTTEQISKESRGNSIEKYGGNKTHTPAVTPPPSRAEKRRFSPRSSRDSSELSYSPARRNPERYREILECLKSQKTEKRKTVEKEDERKEQFQPSKLCEEREKERKERGGRSDRNTAKPIVHLQSQSDDENDVTERNSEKILDEFQELKREKDIEDLKMLEQLKTGIAAKAKEKIKTIEKMAASTLSNSSLNNVGEVSDKSYKRAIRNSLNEFLAANNVAPAVMATCSSTAHNNMQNSPPGAIYPQTLEEIKKEQESLIQFKETVNHLESINSNSNKDSEPQTNCKKSFEAANGHALLSSPTESPVRNSVNVMNKDRDRKRERDYRERERERDRDTKITRENNNFNKERYLERRQKSSPSIYGTVGVGGGGGGSGNGVIPMGSGRRNVNSNIHHINHRQQRLNGNLMGNSGGGGVGGHFAHHIYPHRHHPNHQIINNHNALSSSSTYIANNSTNNQHSLLCNHANHSTNLSFNRPSRINNTPLITATQFNNQMLSKQSNSILVNRRDHRTALNLGLSGTPCTNFSNSNLLLTKANTNSHHLQVAAVGHGIAGGHHHQYHHHHHHHHHGQNSNVNSGGSNSSNQITDRILMAASIAAAQRQSFGVVHSAASSAAALAAANNLNFLQQQIKPKLVIKPFKINDSQPLVAALADSSLVDAIVSKVSTATVAAAESAARRSRSRSRRSRSRSRNRRDEKGGSRGNSNSGGGGGERDDNRRRCSSHSRSSKSSSSSRSRSRSRRSSRSRSSQYSSSSHSLSHSSTSSSFGSSRSGTRSPSIPRRRGSPSFLDRRRITSARKRPIPYHRKLASDASSCYCSSCCSPDSSRSRSLSRDSRSPSRIF